MSYLNQLSSNNLKSRAVVMIEYHDPESMEPEVDWDIFDLNHSYPPNSEVYFMIRGRTPFRDDWTTQGKIDVTVRIPCFREEVDKVFQCAKRSAIYELSKRINGVHDKLTNNNLKILSREVLP